MTIDNVKYLGSVNYRAVFENLNDHLRKTERGSPKVVDTSLIGEGINTQTHLGKEPRDLSLLTCQI